MSELRYSKDHEWIRVDGDVGTVGITNFAQEQLGDVVFVELPAIGAKIDSSKEAAIVESVKAASEIYAPASGEITDINTELEAQPELVNSDPTGKGWFFKVRIDDGSALDALMDEDAYQAFIAGQG
jgi:glycine cleavage system H protein